MSQYYTFVNKTKNEFVEPAEIDNPTALGIASGDSLPLLQYLLTDADSIGPNDFDCDPEASTLMGRWAGDSVSIEGDTSDNSDFTGEEYTDITEMLLNEYNRAVREPELKIVARASPNK